LKLLPFLRLRGFRGKVGAYIHGIEAWRTLSPKQVKLLNSVDQLFAISEHTVTTFRSFNPTVTTPIRVVTLGLGHSTTDITPPNVDVPTALILARMAKAEAYKGHRELIQAWPAVRAKMPGAVLRVLGSGDLQPELAELAMQLGVGEAIQFTGRVSEEQKQAELRAARCFVMPSRGEGLGLVYFEAMRLGRPCLVTLADAGKEVVLPPQCGLGVDVTDTTALADAVVRLLTPGREWDEWSTNAKARYDSMYTEEMYLKRFDGAFAEMLKEPLTE
jgi:phosphatidyl-myo-inositol dimannoside synthase